MPTGTSASAMATGQRRRNQSASADQHGQHDVDDQPPERRARRRLARPSPDQQRDDAEREQEADACRRTSPRVDAAGRAGRGRARQQRPAAGRRMPGPTPAPLMITWYDRRRGPDIRPKSMAPVRPTVDDPSTLARRAGPVGAGRLIRMITVEQPDQAVRPPHRRRRRVLRVRPRHRDRLPRPQRRGQVDHDADARGLTPPTSGTATVSGRPTASCPTRGARSASCSTPRAQHPGRTGREVLTLSARVPGRRPASASTSCSTWSASPGRPPSGGSAATRSACASGSASRTRSSATRGC